MDAKTLRASILQMAIEGKLVPQRDAEPAVEQIGEAPAEVPFDIPEKWKWCFIGNCVNQIRAGGDKPAIFSKDKTADCTIPVIANGEKNLGIVGYTNEGTITQRSLTVSGRGTIGFSVIRTPPFTPIVRLLVVFESPEKHISLEYLQFFLSALKLEGNGSAVKQLTAPMLRQTAIPVPPITEQRRIVTRLNELLPLVDNFGKAQEALTVAQKEFPEKLKASLLQEAIQGKLVPQLDEEPAVEQIGEESEDVPFDFEIPSKWKWVQLNSISSIISKGTTPPGGRDIYTDKGVGFVRLENFGSNGRLIKSSLKYVSSDLHQGVLKRSALCADDVLLGIAGSLGKTCIVNAQDLPLNTNQAVAFIRLNKLIAFPTYIQQVLSAVAINRFLLSQTKTTAIPNLTLKIIRNCIIPLPPISEQRRIVARLDELLPLIKKLAATTGK